MKQRKLASRLMLAGGVAELLLGLLHFAWPTQLVQIGEFARLSTDYQNLLVLCCLAVGLCLTVFGALSIYYRQGLVAGEKSAVVYGLSQGILWVMRAILEILFPVRIPLFFVANPTVLVLPGALLLGLMFLLPLVVFNQEFSKSKAARHAG